MIRHEYTSCAQCHADPSGGGLLTPYGRATGELLMKSRYGKPPPNQEEEPGAGGKFLFGAFSLPEETVLLGGDFRMMAVGTAPEGVAPTVRAFPMQMDVSGQIKSHWLRAAASLGYASGKTAQPAALTRGGGSMAISRYHWVGVDLGEDPQWTVRAGRLQLPFGLRLTEHTLFVRTATATTTQADQQHGIAVAYGGGALRGEWMAIVGNLQLNPPAYRERGYSGFLEWMPNERLAVGASSLITHAEKDIGNGEPRWRHAHGAFARWAPVRPVVLMTEWDLAMTSQPNQLRRTEAVGALIADIEPVRGLHFIATGETQCDVRQGTGCSFGAWGSVAWFFASHADVRADVVWRSQVSTVLLQAHFYL